MAGLIPEPSGCGPGLSRPADTPQQGVRSVLPSRNEAERILSAREMVVYIRCLTVNEEIDWRELQRTAQKLADLAGSMATERGGR